MAQGAILETRDRIPRQAPGAWSLLLSLPMSLPLSLFSLSVCDYHKLKNLKKKRKKKEKEKEKHKGVLLPSPPQSLPVWSGAALGLGPKGPQRAVLRSPVGCLLLRRSDRPECVSSELLLPLCPLGGVSGVGVRREALLRHSQGDR